MAEAWLRGPIQGVHPFLTPLVYTLTEAREELSAITEKLTTEQIWARPNAVASIGFHIRHIGGSATRLMTYAEGKQLDEEQMKRMKSEQEPGATREQLLAELDIALNEVESIAKTFEPGQLTVERGVGRKQLPTTVIGLIVHISEHTLRHLGQATTTAKFITGGS